MIAYVLLAVGLVWAAFDIEDDVADWWIAWALLIVTGLVILCWEWLVSRSSAAPHDAARMAAVDEQLRTKEGRR